MKSARRLAAMTVASIAFYYLVLISLIVPRDFCASCPSSEWWRETAVAVAPMWLFSAYARIRWRQQSPNFRRSMLKDSLLLVNLLLAAAVLAPVYILEVMNQRYDIVYFNIIQFPFSSAMIFVLTLTFALFAFNLSLANRPDNSASRMQLSSLVFSNFSLLVWFVLLVQERFGIKSEFMVFSALMFSMPTIPIFSAFYDAFDRLSPKIKWALRIIALVFGLGPQSIWDIRDFFQGAALSHPFLVVALLSSLCVCLSSAMGKEWSYRPNIDTPQRVRPWIFASIALIVILLVTITLLYTHAAIVVYL
jgi:hypothetical protein